ncbi:MAG: pilus assembly protein PilM [Pseudomonadota bacterium]
MPQNVLGLDIGSFSIKAALFDTTFRSYALTDLFESPPLQTDEIDAAERPVVITEAILRLLKDNRLHPSTIVTALSGTTVSTRHLTLPLPDKQVTKVLPFELESALPFDLEDIIVDHHMIATSKAGTTLLAAAAKKSAITEHLAFLRGAGLEPAFVGLDSLFLYNLNQLTLKNDPSTYAIVDMGHQKTSICIVSNHAAQLVRTLFTAGHAVTDSVRSQLDLTFQQALEAKHSHGILELESHPLRSDDLKRLSAAIVRVLDPLIVELLQTFQSYRAQRRGIGDGNPAMVEKIFLCGGTSLLRNLPEYITARTGLPTSRLALFSDESGVKPTGIREPVLAPAVALGLRAAVRGASAKRVATINFRKGEFAFAKDLTGMRDKALFFGKWVTALFLLGLLHVGFKYNNLAQQKSGIDKVILQEVRRIVPDVKKPPSKAGESLKLLRERIAKYREKQEVLTSGLNDLTALGVLKEVSTRIPADIRMDTQELLIERNRMTLRATVDSFASVDRVISALKENPLFSRIEKGDIRETPDKNYGFQLMVTIGKEPEEKGRKGK